MSKKQKIVAIIGGSQESTFKQIAQKNGFQVLFHDGKDVRKNYTREIKRMVQHADCVVILETAISHTSAEAARDTAKQYNKPFAFHKSRGATGAIDLAKAMVS